jgi:hypothetical protein
MPFGLRIPVKRAHITPPRLSRAHLGATRNKHPSSISTSGLDFSNRPPYSVGVRQLTRRINDVAVALQSQLSLVPASSRATVGRQWGGDEHAQSVGYERMFTARRSRNKAVLVRRHTASRIFADKSGIRPSRDSVTNVTTEAVPWPHVAPLCPSRGQCFRKIR